jgi:hypothetical protein
MKIRLTQQPRAAHALRSDQNGTERNLLSQEETSSSRKKLPVTQRNFLSQEETSCHRKTILDAS